MMGIYSLMLAAALLVSSPYWLMRMLTTQRYREGMRERLGRVPRRVRDTIRGRRVVWLHAVSVGEVLAASRLVEDLGRALGDHWVVVVSTTTRTGQKLARERFGEGRVFYMPLDFAASVRRSLDVLKPAALLLTESEVWPRLLFECRRAHVPVAVVNARVSDRSYRRAMRMRALWRRVLRGVSLWIAQSDTDAQRLLAMGADPDRVQVSGNLKYDVRATPGSPLAERIRSLANGRPILIGGSTVAANPPEESPLIGACAALPDREKPLLVLAPRHPERFAEVFAMASEYPAALASELRVSHDPARIDIIVLDTIGDLAALYAIADVAFIGGSLVRRGGHNPLEPAQFGVPVVMGPSYTNFRDVVERMRAAEGIVITGETHRRSLHRKNVSPALAASLIDDVQRLLRERERAQQIGSNGRAVFEAQQGATARTLALLRTLLERGGSR